MLNEVLVEKKKNYIRCEKIASFRKGMITTEKGKKSKSGYTLFAFEHENGITFSCRHRAEEQMGGGFYDQFKYKFQIRTLKSGEKRFIFYNIGPGRVMGPSVRTSAPNQMRSKLARLSEAQESARKKPRSLKLDQGLYAAQKQRLLVFIRAFLRKHKISFRNLSSDPFSLMTQLCYPGTQVFDDETLLTVSTGRFLLQDPVNLALKTKGKKSRRLVYQVIKKYPKGAQGILRVAKFLRVNHSLDRAQEFLEKLVLADLVSEHPQRPTQPLVYDDGYYEFSLKNLTAKQISIFLPLTTDEIITCMHSHYLINDTCKMIDQLNANEGFDISRIQYKTLTELHEALCDISPRQKKKNFEHYVFNPELKSIQFCELLKEKFNDSNYSMCYAQSTEELQLHAQIMRNCAFFYHNDIAREGYAIFCINEAGTAKDKMQYMFGARMMPNDMARGNVWKLDQAVGKCNSEIDPHTHNYLCNKIRSCLSSEKLFIFEAMKTED